MCWLSPCNNVFQNRLLLSGPENEKVKQEVLDLSLKYSFVTPLTSMVVTKPEGENTEVLDKPKEELRTLTPHGRRVTAATRMIGLQSAPTSMFNGVKGMCPFSEFLYFCLLIL